MEEKKPVELKLKKTFDYHRRTTLSVIHFGDPHHKLVSCSMDQAIGIFDSLSYRRLENIHAHDEYVRQVIHWDQDTFLSCCDAKSYSSPIFAFSIIPPYRKKKTFRVSNCDVYRLLKLTDDLFFVANRDSEMSIVSYSKNKVVRRLLTPSPKYEIIPYMPPKIIKSKNYKNCFYLPLKNMTVILIDYEKNVIVNEFLEPYGMAGIIQTSAFAMIHNSLGEEIIIIRRSIARKSEIFVINTNREKENQLVFHINERKEEDKKRFEDTGIFDSFCWSPVSDHFLAVGSVTGTVGIYDMNNLLEYSSQVQYNFTDTRRKDEVIVLPDEDEEKKLTSLINKPLSFIPSCHSSSVQYIEVGGITEGSTFQLLTCSTDSRIKLIETGIRTIDIRQDPVHLKDLKERVEFLVINELRYFETKNERHILKIDMNDFLPLLIFKSYLLR